MSERDYYGGHASDYAKHRPSYPEPLYKQLLELCPDHELAWDCGTGNGQAAVRLAKSFQRVWASDLSQLQLDQAEKDPKVTYHCNEAHESGLDDNSVSLVTVGTAVHWFDQEKFYKEALRVLKPGGVLAVWSYGTGIVTPKGASEVLEELALGKLRDDWPDGIQWVLDRYETLPFPLPDLQLETVEFPLSWSLENLWRWITTWSAVHRYRKRTNEEPLVGVREKLEEIWPVDDGGVTDVQFPLYLRVGRAT